MSQHETIYLKDYSPSNFTIDTVDLHFDLFEEYSIVSNTMQISCVNKSITLELNAVDLELISLSINNTLLSPKEYIYEDELLKIFNLPKNFTLKIQNKIYPQKNTELEGLYKAGGIFCTQNEPEGFRRITPYLDRPDVMAVFTTTVVAEKNLYPTLLANGNPQIGLFKELNEGRHSTTWHDPHPKPSYLFALVAGDLGSIRDSFTTLSGREIELNIYCDLGNESKCYHAMKSLKESMVWDEEKYGREYDLDIFNIVAVESFNMGAMENKGLNIFNAQAVLADSDVATDANFMRIQSIVAHEYFHNWTGNRITCKNWFQLTLKEGLTVFRDQCFSADLNSPAVQRIEDVETLRGYQFVEDSSPTAHPIQPKSYISMNNFYTATVYEKGAEVIRMIHTLIGNEAYRKATDLYFKTFDGQAVTTEDFLWAMESASGYDLQQFRRWYDQVGTPTIQVKEMFKNNIYTVEFQQIIPKTLEGEEQKPYYFPLKIGLIDQNGEEILEKKLIISQEQETFSFKNLKNLPYLSINRDFSAPIIIDQETSNYAFAMKYDKNSFARYDATQSFGIETLEKLMRKDTIDDAFIESYGYLLDSDLELSYKALLLGLPSNNTLMQKQKEVDFEPILEAQNKLSIHLAQKYKEKLLKIYHENHLPNTKKIDAQSMGQRSLKNSCLLLLSALNTQEIIQLAQKQYRESLSMSDRVVALEIIENSEKYHSEKELKDFYQKYKNNMLVMSKYLSILADSQREGLLQRIIELEKDDIYDEKVPNLLRALIGTFSNNERYFHAKNGSGYEFLANKLLEIDKINAQMASRLAGAFKLYEKMNPTNREHMALQLKRIITTEGISDNLYEIIGKILKVENT